MGYYAGGHQCSGVLAAKETVTLAASGIIVTSTLSTPLTVYADGIPLIWDESDLPKSASASQTSTSSSSLGPTSTSPPASSMDQSGSSGLAEGAKIGIGVGVPLGAIAIGAGVFFYFLRRHRKRRMNRTQPVSQVYVRQSKPAELSSSGARSELESPSMVRHELA
ncbi:hypothetical protein Asppvi_010747 [Aspergillus pseudoviridinutans]|uniref:Mid2 domain-containing protein n=1 Tax=Aspergillus pseudoviridinutans TaxID=1517512 RepID=A0A9P3BJY2_9EURO|nr:uncharacterized protein Asppvi_010747 [Aspergillus pseudoviridinutans]GIJ91774.1 hypothetical protein Asppvi_010747 [Aspergillus pseudoviridinutans]